MTEPTERQVLYALVAGGWLIVVAVLAGVAATVGASPWAWTIGFAAVWTGAVAAAIRGWRRTGRLLLISVGVFVVWVVGALLAR